MAAKKRKMKIEDAATKGLKKLPGGQIEGVMFNLNRKGRLCGCYLGAAAIGAGLIDTKEVIKALHRSELINIDEQDVVDATDVPSSCLKIEGNLVALNKIDQGYITILNDKEKLSVKEINKKLAARRKLIATCGDEAST